MYRHQSKMSVSNNQDNIFPSELSNPTTIGSEKCNVSKVQVFKNSYYEYTQGP